MASDSNSSTVAIVAILVIVLLGGLVAWRMGVFGGSSEPAHKVELHVK